MIKIFHRGNKKLNSDIDTWVVSWWSNHLVGFTMHTDKQNYQAFTNYEEAKEFKESIDRANKLIGNTYKTLVDIEKTKVNDIGE